MTILSDVEILEELKKGNLKIEPFEKEMLGPDSIDIRLGNTILEAKKTNKIIDPLDPKSINFFEEKDISNGYILKPNSFILGTTYEKISLPEDIAAQIEGRSSIGRFGIVVHMTAGIIHAGFGLKKASALTLEISSVNPNDIIIRPMMKIAQLTFFRLGKKSSKGYDMLPLSKYISQEKPEKPKIFMEKLNK